MSWKLAKYDKLPDEFAATADQYSRAANKRDTRLSGR
jgi:hypothetical protein